MNPTPTPPQPRWADQILVYGHKDLAEENTLKQRLASALPDCYGVACCELRKTDFEIKAIASIMALLDIMASKMKLCPRGLNLERIHILTKSDYRMLVGNDECRTVLGHSYISRAEDHTTMMYLLTHELAHLASYLSVIAYLGEKSAQVSWKRSGYTVQTCVNGNLFTGLNEAAAEITAGLMRDMLARHSGLLNEQQRQELLKDYLYAPQVRIVQLLAKTISRREGIEEEEPLMCLIHGFLSGDLSFLRRVGRAVPRSVPILRAMSAESPSALIAAHALGLQETHQRIDGYLQSLNRITFSE